MKSILIVEDDITYGMILKTWLGKKGFQVSSASSIARAQKHIEAETVDLILSDLRLPDRDGIDLLRWLGEHSLHIPLIIMTGYADIQSAVQAMKLGACDYIAKPVNPDELLKKMDEALKSSSVASEQTMRSTQTDHAFDPNKPSVSSKQTMRSESNGNPCRKGAENASSDYLEGESDAARQLYNYVNLVSPTNMSVLINGASGTGKEYVAQRIHKLSRRAKQPFIAIDCGAIPKELAASEFFGHVKGSFTGALTDKTGAFVAANGGTIFLDEIGEMAFELQAKLLRILETGEYIKIGDTKPTRVNVRVVAATNRNLPEEITAGRFREDLFYRLSVFQIHLPPLRERAGDVRILAKAFVKDFSARLARSVTEITPAFLEALEQQPWKGNIRELRNVIERSLIVCESERLDVADLPLDIQNTHYEQSDETTPGSFELSAMERRHIARVLEYTKGNKTEAARLLKIGLTTLYRKIEEYGI